MEILLYIIFLAFFLIILSVVVSCECFSIVPLNSPDSLIINQKTGRTPPSSLLQKILEKNIVGHVFYFTSLVTFPISLTVKVISPDAISKNEIGQILNLIMSHLNTLYYPENLFPVPEYGKYITTKNNKKLNINLSTIYSISLTILNKNKYYTVSTQITELTRNYNLDVTFSITVSPTNFTVTLVSFPFSSFSDFGFKGISDFYIPFEKIKNTLFLSSPYIVSKNAAVVTVEDESWYNQHEKEKKDTASQGICFGGGDSSSPLACIASGGIYDYPATGSSFCPFYKANTNYPNNRGGSNASGYCELPQNMQLIGFTKYSSNPKYSPLCYNCKTNLIGQGTLGTCCEKQLDKNVYPNLKSPDYAFVGDKIDRNIVVVKN